MGTKKESKKVKKRKMKNGDSSIKIGDENEFKGDTVIGRDITFVKNPDNSVNYEIDTEDVMVLKKISPYLIGRYGKKKISFIGIISLISGLISIFTWMNSIISNVKIYSYLPAVPAAYSNWVLFLGFIFFVGGVLLLSITQYHTSTQCKICKKEFAYEEVGTPTVKEVKTSEGTRKITTRTYECKFCGDEDIRKDNKLIEEQTT